MPYLLNNNSNYQNAQISTFSTTYQHNKHNKDITTPTIYQTSYQHHQRRLSSSNSYNMDTGIAQQQQLQQHQMRCASVKNRPSPARRISAAELEHLMIRQNASTSQFQPINCEQQVGINNEF